MVISMAFHRTHIERILCSFEEIRDVKIAVDHILNDVLIESILHSSRWTRFLGKDSKESRGLTKIASTNVDVPANQFRRNGLNPWSACPRKLNAFFEF